MPASEIEILRVVPDELGELVKMSRTTFSETYARFNTSENMKTYLEYNFGHEQLSRELNNPASLFYFARAGKENLGYFKVNFEAAQTVQRQNNSLELERIYVPDTSKGKGIGRLMLQKAIETARHHQLECLWLGVWEQNPKAIRFYKRNGFTIYGTHIFKLGDDDQADYLMKLQIT